MLGAKLFPEASLGYAAMVSFIILGCGIMAYTANRFKLIQK
jgi:hypothetical protein